MRMRFQPPTLGVSLLVLVASLSFACGGKTVGVTPGSPDSGPIPRPTPDPGPGCVQFTPPLTTSDLACQNDSDCSWTFSGEVCPDQCACTVVAVNNDAAQSLQGQVPQVGQSVCGCGTSNALVCVQGQCTSVPPTPIFDAGPVPVLDAGPGPSADASTCVFVDVSGYSTFCNGDSDCINLQGGQICNGDCDCGGGTAVSASEQSAYDQATSGIQWGECACPLFPSPVCMDHVCGQAGDAGASAG